MQCVASLSLGPLCNSTNRDTGWMLRAAYFGQELLSTFGTDIGEIALIPATGGLFQVHLTHLPTGAAEAQGVLLWDRKTEGGFPETKVLKQLVRNQIDPNRNLGHSDKGGHSAKQETAKEDAALKADENAEKKEDCQDCK